MDSNEIREALEAHLRTFHEIAEKRIFTAYRETEDGEEQITFEFYDYGPDFLAGRYACVVTTESGATATGNPADSIAEVLSIVHWKKLDPISEIVIRGPDGEIDRLHMPPKDDE